MSYTLRFTPFHSLRYETVSHNAMSHGCGVRILDREGLENALTDTLVKQMDTRSYTDRSTYPRQEWDQILGFRTFKPDDDHTEHHHNVSNVGPTEFAQDELATVSEYTDPFTVWLSEYHGGFPHAAQAVDGTDDGVYQAVAFDGDVWLRHFELQPTNMESVDL